MAQANTTAEATKKPEDVDTVVLRGMNMAFANDVILLLAKKLPHADVAIHAVADAANARIRVTDASNNALVQHDIQVVQWNVRIGHFTAEKYITYHCGQLTKEAILNLQGRGFNGMHATTETCCGYLCACYFIATHPVPK